MTSPDGLSSDDHGDDGEVTEPGSFEVGPPPGSKRKSPRLLQPHIDAWLDAGGWAGGEAAAGSVAALPVDGKQRLRNALGYELRVRGWTGLVSSKFVRRGRKGKLRLYWWTTDEAARQPMPGGVEDAEDDDGQD